MHATTQASIRKLERVQCWCIMLRSENNISSQCIQTAIKGAIDWIGYGGQILV